MLQDSLQDKHQQEASVDSGTGINLETQNLKRTNKCTMHACLTLIKSTIYILVMSKHNFFDFFYFLYIVLPLLYLAVPAQNH